MYLLIIDAKIQDTMGAAAFGAFFPLLSLGVMLNILLDVGLVNHMTRLVAANPSEVHAAFKSGWRTKRFLFPVYILLLGVVGWFLGYRGVSFGWLLWIGLNQAILSAILYVRAGLQGTGAHRTDAWISIADRTLLLVGMGALLISFEHFHIEWLLGGTTLALAFTWSIAWWRLKVTSRQFASPVSSEGTTQHDLLENLKQGWPYALLFLLMMTYHRVDAIMLERLAPNGMIQAGWYAKSYRLFEAANMIGYLFATLLLPYFSRMIAEKEDIRPLAIATSRILLVGSGAVLWAAWFFPTGLLGAFYSVDVAQAAPVLPWLMISFTIFAQGYVFSTILTAQGNLRVLNRLAALGAAINIALNAWWLLNHADATSAGWGCAIISAITQGLVVAGQMAFSMRAFPGRSWWNILRALLIHGAFCAAITWAFVRFAPDNSWTVWFVLGACLLAGAAPGVMDYRIIRDLLSKKMNTFADSLPIRNS